MKNSLDIAVWIGACCLVAGCETTGTQPATSSPDPEVIDGNVRVFEHLCMKEMEAGDFVERQEFVMLLAVNDMTPEKFCECTGRTFLGSMNQDDLIQFVDDSRRYKDVTEHEPWKSMSATAYSSCIAGVWPE